MSDVKKFRCKYARNILIHHLNINSFRYKFNETCHILYESLADILVISETKLNDSFPTAQFHVPNFSIYRKDRNCYGGGLVVYINSLFPHCLRNDFNDLFCDGIEGLVFEVNIKKRKWLLLPIYKPPNVSDVVFIPCFSKIVECMLSESPYIIVIGDLNFDMNVDNNLQDCCSILGLKNLIKSDTCFKSLTPTSLDVILTPNSSSFVNDYLNTDIGLSDCHNLIGCALKTFAPQRTTQKVTYRSYRKFIESNFLEDLSLAPLTSCFKYENANDQMNAYNEIFSNVLDKHAPIKQRIIKKTPPPFMNNNLRKAIYKKCMLRNKFYKDKSDRNWLLYKSQRNKVTQLRRLSIRNYFTVKTQGVSNSGDFWKIIKPFITDKHCLSDEHIMLRENNTLITNTVDVCNVFNDYFTNVANTIGFQDKIPLNVMNDELLHFIITKFKHHPSIQAIHRQNIKYSFHFNTTTEQEVGKVISELNIKKSMGYDFISPKVLKMSSSYITPVITTLINNCIQNYVFPSELKLAEVASLFKKNDKLTKENYRPISILIIMSKVFEKIFATRITEYFLKIFSPFISAYRPGCNCEQVLIKFVSVWKRALDNNIYFGSIMMDLSKAFDCLPHCLIISKCYAYGFDRKSCLLLASYLSNRMQRVKISSSRSQWKPLDKGVPQGSILGPILFNVFLNDIFYFIEKCCLLNYADDNTLVFCDASLDNLVTTLSNDSNTAVKWFHDNGMQANPEKFQAMISHRHIRTFKSVIINDISIEPLQCVKLLGVTFDINLSFDTHIDELCKKASRSLNVLKRFSTILSLTNRKRIYHTFICSQFNYCSIVWHFSSKRKIKMMEKIQERALRFVYNDFNSDYNDLLTRINKDSLHCQRLKAILVFVYKCVHNLGPVYLNSLFEIKQCKYMLRNDFLICQPKMNTITHGINSLLYHGSKMWNVLPMYIKNATTLKRFKSHMKLYKQKLCQCTHCIL